jgi:hypothetical protein
MRALHTLADAIEALLLLRVAVRGWLEPGRLGNCP